MLTARMFRLLVQRQPPRTGLKQLLCVVLATLCWSVAATAQQVQMRHEPLEPNEIAVPFIVLEVPLSLQPFADAYNAYLDGYLKLAEDLNAEAKRYRDRRKMKPGAQMDPEEVDALQGMNWRATDTHQKLMGEFAERIKASLPPEEADAVEKARELLSFQVLTERGHFFMAPPDINRYFSILGPELRSSLPVVRTALTSNLAQRARAYRAFLKSSDAEQVKQAEIAKAAGLVGLMPQEAQKEGAVLRSRITELSKSPDENKAELEALKTRANALSKMGLYRSKITPEWLAVAREELVTLRAIESTGPLRYHYDHLVYEYWLPRAVSEFPNSLLITDEKRNGGREPSELIRDVMRLPGLTQDQRDTVRTMGRALIKAYRARMLKRVEDAIAAGSYREEYDSDGKWFRGELNKIGVAIGHAELGVKTDGGFALIPTIGLADTIPDADAAEFGPIYAVQSGPRSTVRWYARSSMQPAPYPENLAQQLQELLRIPSELAPVVQMMATDAEARWNASVKPLLQDLDPRPGVAAGDNEVWGAELARSRGARQKAFEAAAACDNEMLDALAAGLGAKADLNALATLRASLRTAECTADGSFALASMLDGPRAVLEAPMSNTARRVMMEEFAPMAQQWIDLASKALQARILVKGSEFRPIEGAEAKESMERASTAWDAAEREMIERMAAKLSPADAEAWRAWVRRNQWPRAYAGATGFREWMLRGVGTGPDAEKLLAAVEPIIAQTVEDIQRAGDRSVEIWLSAAPRRRFLQSQVEFQGELRELFERTEPYNSINMARSALARELIAQRLPPDAVRRLNMEPIFAPAASPE